MDLVTGEVAALVQAPAGVEEHRQQDSMEGLQPLQPVQPDTKPRCWQNVDRAAMHVHTHQAFNDRYEAGAAWVQGYRPSMEDAHIVELNVDGSSNTALVAVFDGHGGSDVANFCARNVVRVLTMTLGYSLDDLPRALRETFFILDEDVIKSCASHIGATCTTALIRDGKLMVAGVGDSRCVLSRGGRPVIMTCDHKPEDPKEENRIREAGGFVFRGRVNACLNVSRALGDAEFKQAPLLPADQQQVSPEPDIASCSITAEDEFLVVACDGVWNAMSEEQVLAFVSERLDLVPLDEICKQLCRACLEPGRTAYDNITSIVLRLKGLPTDSLVRST